MTTALVVGYFALRFGPLHVGMPALIERSSGVGFRDNRWTQLFYTPLR